MLNAYYEHTSDSKLIYESLRALDTEYEHFMKERSTVVNLHGTKHKLNLFRVDNNKPRPESFKEDYEGAQVFDSEKKQKVSNKLKNFLTLILIVLYIS
jgi:alpha,alpha-trehalase